MGGLMVLDQIKWKETATLLMPELAEALTSADTPYSLWFVLWDTFKVAYNEPRNGSLIARIYKYADWCETQPRGETAAEDFAHRSVRMFS